MKLLVLLFPVLARADVRVEAHVGGGLEAGGISGEPRPDGVGEFGGGLTWFGRDKGIGFVVERVDRLSHDLPTASETKLDAMFALRAKRAVLGFGAGLRAIEVAGGEDRPGSTLWGVDVMRLQTNLGLTRIGPVQLEIYFAWTFGFLKGELYEERRGDMAYPVRDYWTMTSSYVLGVCTSFDTQP